MRVGVNLGSHAFFPGGGWKAAWWHVTALRDLGAELTIFVTSSVHETLMPKLHGLPIRWYKVGCEAEFDGFLTVNHFGFGQPLAKDWNIQHIMFPSIQGQPPDGLTLTSNSAYTASHIKDRWTRDAQPLYIPIESDYRIDRKEKVILHVSRFAERNEFADKAHPQLIQAVRMNRGDLPGWKLIMAGAVEKNQHEYVNSLMQMASGYPIEFMFDPTDEELRNAYSKSAILWHATGVGLPTLPDAQEHLGLTPLEASASGCVPIVYKSGGMPEVVLDHRTGLLFDDIRQMGKMTVELIGNLHLWAAFAQQGQMWIKSWQDYPAFVERVQQTIEGKPVSLLPNYLENPEGTQADVTCVIPTYNNAAMLSRCLNSLKTTAPDMPILVMNNGDPLALPLDGATVYHIGYNAGFAGAYRLAEPMVQTKFVLALNDDTEAISRNWLELMLLPFNDSSVGIVGAKLIFPDGSIQHAGGYIDWRRDDIGYHRWYRQPDNLEANQTSEPDFVTGAALLARRELFHMPAELEGLLNFEDVWVCLAAREAGYRIVYQPATALRHFEGATKSRTPESQEKVEQAKAIFRARWMK